MSNLESCGHPGLEAIYPPHTYPSEYQGPGGVAAGGSWPAELAALPTTEQEAYVAERLAAIRAAQQAGVVLDTILVVPEEVQHGRYL